MGTTFPSKTGGRVEEGAVREFGAGLRGELLGPLREFGSPLEDTIRPMSYAALQGASDEGFPSGRQH